MFKKRDIIIFAIIAALFGFFLVRQFYASREAFKLTQPETNQVIALEVANLTKTNTELRQEVFDLDARINNYKKSLNDQVTSDETISRDLQYYREINGSVPITGKGVILKINQNLTQPQQVDLANTIRNIGTQGFSINGDRVSLSYHFGDNAKSYEIVILGNPTLIQSALTRKGGFLDELFPIASEYSISQKEDISLSTAPESNFTFANIAN